MEDEFKEWDRFEAFYESSPDPLIAMERYRAQRRREELRRYREDREKHRRDFKARQG